MVDPSSGELAISVVTVLVSWLGAFSVHKIRLDAMKEQIARDREHDREMLDLKLKPLTDGMGKIERRQLASLQILATMAHKMGVDSRALGEDALVKYLADESDD